MKGWSGKEDEGGGRLKTMKAQRWERDGKRGEETRGRASVHADISTETWFPLFRDFYK